MKNTQMLLRRSFDLILNSSQYLCPRHVHLAFTYFLTFSRSLHPTTFIIDTVISLSGQIAFANISASSTLFAPIRFYCACFIHRLTSHPSAMKNAQYWYLSSRGFTRDYFLINVSPSQQPWIEAHRIFVRNGNFVIAIGTFSNYGRS